MTIGVLMATCSAFVAIGWEGPAYAKLALMVGAVVCIAISNAGTCSQDLKTGFLLGATPVKQQGALLVGVLTSVLAVGWTAYLLNLSETTEKPVAAFAVAPERVQAATQVKSVTDGKSYAFVKLLREELPAELSEGIYLVDPATNQAVLEREDGIGAGKLKAPQARLMSTVIDGMLNRRLPWDLILLGVAIAVLMELLGVRSLTFAVGVYLPLASTLPVFLGGLVRKLADKFYRREPDAEDEPEGTLFSSGVIAGAAILSILAAGLSFLPGYDKGSQLYPPIAWLVGLRNIDTETFPGASDALGLGVLLLLAFLMFRGAAPSKKA
jgi:uncharacterized oligopeptide transporter (OPT) family protein